MCVLNLIFSIFKYMLDILPHKTKTLVSVPVKKNSTGMNVFLEQFLGTME